MTRRIAVVGGLVAAAVLGSVATITATGGRPATAAPGPLPAGTATVVRTDLAQTQLTGGTLGYAPTSPVVNRLAGTYTALPDPGTTIQPGATLYRVDDMPVVLMAGSVPAWRPFAPGMTDGSDVRELQAGLVALGYAHGLIGTPSGHFDEGTVAAVERWQTSLGQPATGQLALGSITFLPTAVRVGAPDVAVGEEAVPGSAAFEVTTTTRVVSVPLTPDLPSVHVGETVTIVLPDSTRTPGSITTIGPPPPGGGAGSGQSGQSSGGDNGSGQPPVTAIATVTPDHADATGTGVDVTVQVSLTVASAQGVLAVPIPALLALAGGGYGLDVVEPSGAHRLVGVTTGLFTGTEVEVRGSGITSGTKVVVAQ